MNLQLDHIFAGEGMRRREVQQQTAVDGLAVGRPEVAQRSATRRWQVTGERTCNLGTGRTGQADDRDRRAAGRGGAGCNRLSTAVRRRPALAHQYPPGQMAR